MRHPDEVPEEFEDMVGEDAYLRMMRELVALGKEHGFLLLVACNLWAPDHVKETRDELGFELISYSTPIVRYMNELGRTSVRKAGLQVSDKDPHYSPKGHELIAEYLVQYFEKSTNIRARTNALAASR